jgi:hypothetical protein
MICGNLRGNQNSELVKVPVVMFVVRLSSMRALLNSSSTDDVVMIVYGKFLFVKNCEVTEAVLILSRIIVHVFYLR